MSLTRAQGLLIKTINRDTKENTLIFLNFFNKQEKGQNKKWCLAQT